MWIGQGGGRIPQAISGLGLLFILVIIAEGAYLLFISNPLGIVWVAGLVTSLPFALWVVYAGAWLPDSFVSASRYRRVGVWCFGGLSAFLAINISIMIAMGPDGGFRSVSWVRWAATLGAGIGLLIGTFEVRGIERAVEAERERVRAEEAEAKEDFIAYLNAMLRHEVLNTASVIVGHADLALSEYDGNGTVPDRIETIRSRTQEMEGVIEDVRLLLQASRSQIDTEPIDITNLLAEEIDNLQNTHERMSIDTSLPEHATVRADQPLRRAFANLLWNAVEHNDSDTPRIEVSVRKEPEAIVVRIDDNGPGIPEDELDTLFDREIRHDDNHGLGLALAETLVNNYNGTLEVTDTGPDGTVFTLRFPRASEPTPGPDVQTGSWTGQ